MPDMDEVLSSLSEASVFSTLDISSGFWGLAVRKSDQKDLSFHGFWRVAMAPVHFPAYAVGGEIWHS